MYRGSFRIDFLGFGSYFVCVCVCVCFFFFGCIFWLFSVRFWVFLCADFLVFWLGFYVIAAGVFSRFQVWFTKGNLMVSVRFFVVEFLGNLLGCLGVFCELFRKKMVRVGWDGEMERMKLRWDGLTEEKWEETWEGDKHRREKKKLIKKW